MGEVFARANARHMTVEDLLWFIGAVVSLVAWLWLALLRGGFWRTDQRLPPATPAIRSWPSVTAVVPARNEAAVIGRTLPTLLIQDYPGTLKVFLVDDDSDDGTSEFACEAAKAAPDRLTVLRAPSLSEGWAGKMNAVNAGVQVAVKDQSPDYFLFTDADIVHGRQQLRRLVAHAERNGLVLASLMAMLRCRNRIERLLIPAFVFFFRMLFPFRWSNDPRRRTAAAAGGCMLVRRDALEASGGIEAIGDALIDDCALAAQLKPQGPIWLGLTDKVASIRPYDTLNDIWGMVRRTAYTQLRYNSLLLIGTVLGMGLLFLAPPVLTLAGLLFGQYGASGLAATAWLVSALLYRPTARLYGLSPFWWFCLPFAGLLYTGMTVDSARMHIGRQGGGWKGRTYNRQVSG